MDHAQHQMAPLSDCAQVVLSRLAVITRFSRCDLSLFYRLPGLESAAFYRAAAMQPRSCDVSPSVCQTRELVVVVVVVLSRYVLCCCCFNLLCSSHIMR